MALTGRAILLMALGLVPAVLTGSETVAVWWILGVLLTVGLDALAAPRRRALTLTRRPVEPVRLTETGTTTLRLTNSGTRGVRGAVRDAWQPSAGTRGERHEFRLSPGESVELTTGLAPTRRGDLRADRVTVRTRGPLGLAMRQGPLPAPGVVRVLPAFPSRKHLPGLVSELRMLDGRSAVRTRGQGTEFDSLRDYVPGDDVRSIDWRATARRSNVVVRTWRPERDRQIVLLLDTSRTSAARIGDVPRLDAAMDAGLLLAALTSRAGDRVDLVAGDQHVRRVSAGGTGGRQDRLHEIVEAMAPLHPSLLEADWTRLAAQAIDLTRGRALMVLLTPLEPVVVEETLLPALSALTSRHRVVLASVRDPELDTMTESAFDEAAAEYALARRRRTADVLTGLGVTVLDLPPDELPLALSELYLDLKARGLL